MHAAQVVAIPLLDFTSLGFPDHTHSPAAQSLSKTGAFRRSIILALEARLYSAPYVWTEQYQNALFALDAERLFAEIAKAEAAIQRRKSELLQGSTTGSDELAAAERALQVLVQLREIEHKRYLGWDWSKTTDDG